MRKLITTLSLSFAVLLGSIGSNSALPPCDSSSSNWNNCLGTYTFANGDKYVGEFKDNKQHGQGTFTWGSGSEWAGRKYVGEYKDNKQHGQGTTTLSDGSKFVGEFKDNKFQGQGTYTHANGTIWEGVWQNNKFLYARSASKYRKLKKKR
jgi:hypothetical protein